MSIYYAIEFDEQTKKKLSLKQLEVKQGSTQGDFVQPETFHITVLFCAGGNSGYSREEYINALDEFSKRYNPKPFNVRLQNFGKFQNDGEGAVVWVGVRDSLPLYEIQKNLKETLHSMNVKVEKTQFSGYTPHITMGYDVVLSETFTELFEDEEPITIKSICLWDGFKSRNQDKEAHVYNKIHEVFFE